VPGTLTIAATPIGNPRDAGGRLISALAEADIIAAEDTRRLRRLADDLEVPLGATVLSLFEGNEAGRTEQLLHHLRDGRDVLLVSDAGMPLVSDPGYRLVAACAAGGIRVRVLPGPSAVVAALAASGLPADRFCFEGFLPRKPAQRRRHLQSLADEERTMVLFESPRRVGGTLADLAAAFGGDRAACVCRELTKTHEEVRRGSLADLARWAADGLLGEITLVVAGATPRAQEADPQAWRDSVAALVEAGRTRRDAIDEVARATGAPRKAVYRAVHE
jgi:16S rRNA (cytidine1402-2'-O)-methyltransferase